MIALLVLLMAPPAPVCDTPPDLLRTMEGIDERFQELPRVERYRASKAFYEKLRAEHPREIRVFAKYGEFLQFTLRGDWPAERDRWVARAEGGDAMALTLGAMALVGRDTPRALRLLDEAVRKEPGYGPAWLQAVSIYRGGQFVDTARAGQAVAAYFEACPDSTDSQALAFAGQFGSKELQQQVARRLRARLEGARAPLVLRSFAELWALEFRLRPVGEHVAARAQVRKDAGWLAALPGPADAELLATIRKGFQLAEAPEKMAVAEERLLREFPGEYPSLRARAEGLRKRIPSPKKEAGAAEWDRYAQEWYEAVADWGRLGPHSEYAWSTLIAAVSNWRAAPAALVEQVAEGYLRVMEERRWPRENALERVAELYLDRGLRTERALALLAQARPMVARAKEILDRDDLDATHRTRYEDSAVSDELALVQLELRGYQRAGLVKKAADLRAEVNGPEPKQEDLRSDYWQNRGLLAWVEGRKADAVAYYQSALRLRTEAPAPRRGRVEDPLMEQARALWAELRGTEAGFAVWAKVPEAAEKAPQGAWLQPDKALPAFELSDLEGKVWRSKDLAGKTVFLNLWATWCGPCQQELPQLQKFWSANKDRKDLVIVTLNADEQLGVVAPFLKEHGYTFPVLPAWPYMNQVLGNWAIPQNWVVDAQGWWRWQQIGFDDGVKDWAGAMLAKIDGVR